MPDILSGNTDPSINPYWGKFEVTSNGRHVNAALKTGTTNDTKDLSAYGFLAPPDDPNAPAIAIGVWMGNSDNSRTKGVFSLESTAPLYQAFLNEIVKTHPAGDFKEPPKIVHAKVDAWTGLLPGPFSAKTVDEIFIAGTVPTKRDDTKVGIDVDSATGDLWADGCTGPMETRGFLDLSGVDAGFPAWQKADQDWLARAKRGAGVRGGPAKGTKTATAFFYRGRLPALWRRVGERRSRPARRVCPSRRQRRPPSSATVRRAACSSTPTELLRSTRTAIRSRARRPRRARRRARRAAS